MAEQPLLPPKRRRRSFGFWAAVVLLAGGVLYPLSCGPSAWLAARGYIPMEAHVRYVDGMMFVYERAPQPVQAAMEWYSALWVPAGPPDIIYDPITINAVE